MKTNSSEWSVVDFSRESIEQNPYNKPTASQLDEIFLLFMKHKFSTLITNIGQWTLH
jgi:hypothetical protein